MQGDENRENSQHEADASATDADAPAPILSYYVPTAEPEQTRADRDRWISFILLNCVIVTIPGTCLVGGLFPGGLATVLLWTIPALIASMTVHATLARRYRTRTGLGADEVLDASLGCGAVLCILIACGMIALVLIKVYGA
jgi:hypothetical protein